MPEIDGGTLAVRALQREGVRCIFTVSGGGMMPIYRAAQAAGIQLIHTRHEGAAAFMADGWARTTGQPGVCLVTQGPGVTNTTTGITAAWEGASPCIVLASHVPVEYVDLGYMQCIDHLALVQPITKWARTVHRTEQVPEYIAMAYRHALAGKPGPVFLDFPGAVLAGKVADSESVPPDQYRTVSRPYGDPQQIQKAVELIEQAERPVVIGGGGLWWSQASEALQTFLEAAQAPLFTRRIGRSALPGDHPLNFGLANLSENGVALYATQHSDLIVVVGTRFQYDLEYGRPPYFNPEARVIQIDVDAAEIGRNRPVEVGIIGDARAVLSQLTGALAGSRQPRHESWLQTLREARAQAQRELEPYLHSDEVPINPLRIYHELKKVLTRDTIVVNGHGDFDFWGGVLLDPYVPGYYLRAGQTGVLGAEIPYALAAQLAHPDKRVVVTVGDGGFGFHGMEMETAARYNLPIILIVGNDSHWGMIKSQQEAAWGPGNVVATGMVPRAYEKVVEALGGHGELVTEPAQIEPALRRALESGKPACLNIVMRSVPSPEIRWQTRRWPYPQPLLGYGQPRART